MATERLPPHLIRLPRWTEAEDARLCELVADGVPVSRAGPLMGKTSRQALGRFQRLAARQEGRVR